MNFYNWIQRRSPWMHKAFYTVVEGLSLLNRRTVTFGRPYYERVLREYRPHLVFSVHDCLNRGYFQLARKILGPANVRCATYCGEFSGGWGYSWNWVEPTVDLYFSRTATASDFAVKLGMPPAKARVRGYLMQPRAHLEIFTPEERRRYREKKLGLQPRPVHGVPRHRGQRRQQPLRACCRRWCGTPTGCQAIVICGRNHQTYNELVHWRAQHPEFSCFIDSFSDVMHLLMQASDAIVTRGGTTTCAKALHFKCPIIFNAFGGIMPQEQLTGKFFRNGARRRAGAERGAVPRADRPLDGRPGRRISGCAENFLQLRYEEDPTVLIEELVGLAQEVAGIKLTRLPFPPPNGDGTVENAGGWGPRRCPTGHAVRGHRGRPLRGAAAEAAQKPCRCICG